MTLLSNKYNYKGKHKPGVGKHCVQNHSSLISCPYLPSHQVLHGTQVSDLKVPSYKKYLTSTGSTRPFFLLSAHLPYTGELKATYFFHSSAAFAHFPALFLVSTE